MRSGKKWAILVAVMAAAIALIATIGAAPVAAYVSWTG